MRPYEYLFLDHSLRRYCLTDQEIEQYCIDSPIFLTYNSYKHVVATRLKKYIKNVISVGYDCLPATLCVRWALRKNYVQGRLSCPFDAQFTPMPAVKKIIECDFSNFTANTIEYFDGIRRTCFINKDLDVTFNHDYPDPTITTANNINKFNKKLKQRAQNFRISVHAAPALFILHEKSKKPSILRDIEDLSATLKTFCPESSLIVINEIDSPADAIRNADYILNIVPPLSTYVWYKHYMSERGFYFEKEIVDFISDWILRTARQTDNEIFIDERRDYRFYNKAALWLSTISPTKSLDCLDRAYVAAQYKKNQETEFALKTVLKRAEASMSELSKTWSYSDQPTVRDFLFKEYLENAEKIRQLTAEKTKIKRQLSYRIGAKLVELTKTRNPFNYLKIPFALLSEYRKFKKERAAGK